ncbi:Hsp70 family protein [Aspergillus affinis]|uniref:Hsp70 family protein n=1 Tax=Aspergillus affinis TaxID=1070780 RepID=UPI0022FED5C9|nr:actin-like ATPase domain-containing protein [Aspergillus affinis]KAI9037958.1 actin-like ATPase domain-containing protein [Aspergillus affinis]
MPRIQWIKLGLAPDQKDKSGTRLSSAYNDSRENPVPYHSSPEQVATDYLRHLREHIVDILKTQISSLLDVKNLQFVLTVPAIWPEKAKVATLHCAQEAGYGQASEIRIISEPEAAAVHALRNSNPHGLEVDDIAVLLDAGGGACDLITFCICELHPTLRLKEAAPGNGSLCGSTSLNRRFEKFLEEHLSLVPGWERVEEAMQRFEFVAKRTFTGNANDDIMIPVPGISDDENIEVSRGRLRVTGDNIAQIFLPVLEEVHNLVKDQIHTSKKQVKAIILVGGFGQSPYLRKYLRDSFSPDIEVLTPADGWTAVVRGALRKTLRGCSASAAQTHIESRMARKNYGLICSVVYDPSLHDQQKAYWSEFYGHYRIDVMSWFTKKGHRVTETEPNVTKWLQQQLVHDSPFDEIKTRMYELDDATAPLYFNRRKYAKLVKTMPFTITMLGLDIKEHAVLEPKLHRIQRSRMPTRWGADGQKYYQISFEIHAFYYCAHCKYEIWYEGKNHGSVKVEYV